MSHDQSALRMTLTRRDAWTVALVGDLDASSGAELRSLAGLLSAAHSRVDFDLAEVRFIDTAGWASLCAAQDDLERSGVPARILNPSRAVRHLTELIARNPTTARAIPTRRRLALLTGAPLVDHAVGIRPVAGA
jgi:anti-anti-sigma regulatory factor